MAKKKAQENELLENPDAIADRLKDAEAWAEENPKLIFGIISVLLLVVGGYLGYRYYIGNQNNTAQQEMFQAIRYFESDSLNLALNGDGNSLGFLDIIDDFGGTKAANLSHFYAGNIFLKRGNFETAILYLQDFSANDILIQPRAYSLLGDAYMEQGKFDEAVEYYNKAANYKPNKYFTPGYLMKEALAYEKLNDKDHAIEAYDKIIESYWESAEFQNAQKFKVSLQGVSSN